MQELYVYYQVEPDHLVAARAAFAQLCVELQHHLPGLQSRLLMRPAAPGAVQTWMEVHVWPAGHGTVPDDWPARIEGLARAGHSGLRHLELFEPLPEPVEPHQ